MHDAQIESQVDKVAVPLWVIAALLGCLVLFSLCDSANAESPTGRMAAVGKVHTDSIVGPCDTTTVIDTAIARTIHDPYRQFPNLTIIRIDTLGIYHLHATRLAYRVFHEVIYNSINCEAVIKWREVKR